MSVGEIFSAEMLIKKIYSSNNEISIIFTVTTNTGYDVAKKYISPYVEHIDYLPYDIPWVITKFISVISPDKVIFIETDLWPNAVFLIKKLGIPLYFVNAKMSEKTYRKFNLFKSMAYHIFLPLDRICVQTYSDKKRFLNLGLDNKKILVSGNIKFDQGIVKISINELQRLKFKLGLYSTRPVIVAGSTHSGEEKVFVIALNQLIKMNLTPILILAPRNTKRVREISNMFKSTEMDLTVKKFSDLIYTKSKEGCIADVIIVDQMGILKKLYALSDIVFIGGSMVNKGGHNMLEPALFSKPILFGSYVDDFEYIANAIEKKGGGIRVNSTEQLIKEIASLLSNPDKVSKIGTSAFNFYNSHKGATEKIIKFLNIIS